MSDQTEDVTGVNNHIDGEDLTCTADYLYTAYYDAQAFKDFDGSVEIPELDVNLKASEGFVSSLIDSVENVLGVSTSVAKILLIAVLIFIVKNLLTTSTKDVADIASSIAYLKSGGV